MKSSEIAESDKIRAYVDAVEQHLLGTIQEKSDAKNELLELLGDAADAGELDASIRRLGSPKDAAQTFSRDRTRPLAPVGERLIAASIDNLPLIAVALGLFIQGIGTGSTTLAFPPFAYLNVAGGCVALVPFCDVYNGGWIHAIGLPIALAWSIIGLGLLESWRGQTPGKRLMGLRVVTEEGIRIAPQAGIVRRLSFLLGPLAWLDWMPALWGDRQRVLDKVNATKVIVAAASSTNSEPASETETESKTNTHIAYHN
jgi:uncharacterized RDD family membrane protein YckC